MIDRTNWQLETWALLLELLFMQRCCSQHSSLKFLWAKAPDTISNDLLPCTSMCILDLDAFCAGQLMAPNLKNLSLKMSDNLHWSCLEACPLLERVTICLQPSLFDPLAYPCELSLEGCKSGCLQSIVELHLIVSILKEDGQFRGLMRHKLSKMSMVIRQPQASTFIISQLGYSHWAVSCIMFGDCFSCNFQK